MQLSYKKYLAIIIFTLTFVAYGFAQEPVTKPTPPEIEDDPIQVFTEEIHLNVTVQSIYGDSVPKITADDLLVVESGDPQKITSIRRVAANVLVLLDNGGNLNFAKSINMSRLTAKLLVQNLSNENTIAVMQSYNKIETVSDWTNDREKVQDDLDKKLFGGNRLYFTDSIESAVKMFKLRPIENRHLVFIGDGLDSIADDAERQNALKKLLAANITVHVIGYNKMEAKGAKSAARPFQIGEKNEAPRIPDQVLEGIIDTLPIKMKDNFRRFAKSDRLFIIRLDRARLRLAKQKQNDWKKSESELQNLSEDTGGMFQAPEELNTMWTFAIEIAKAIDSNYVITYTPTKPITESTDNQERKVRVSSHLSGIKIRSRHKILTITN